MFVFRFIKKTAECGKALLRVAGLKNTSWQKHWVRLLNETFSTFTWNQKQARFSTTSLFHTWTSTAAEQGTLYSCCSCERRQLETECDETHTWNQRWRRAVHQLHVSLHSGLLVQHLQTNWNQRWAERGEMEERSVCWNKPATLPPHTPKHTLTC